MTTDLHIVLCAVDLSDVSRRALRQAAAIAGWYDAELVALHVLPPVVPMALPGPVTAVASPVPLVAEDGARRDLEAFVAREVGDGVRATSTLAVGPAVPAIVEASRRLAADLVVLGTHGHGGLRHVLLGSVAESVLRQSPCPVLTVPPGATGDAASLPVFTRILCGVDFSEASLAGVEYALALARTTDATTTLLHVVEGGEDATAHAEASRRLGALVPADSADWCDAVVAVRTGKAGPAILELAREAACDLIVMGIHGRQPLSQVLFGSTVHHILQHAPCPVLTVRPSTA